MSFALRLDFIRARKLAYPELVPVHLGSLPLRDSGDGVVIVSSAVWCVADLPILKTPSGLSSLRLLRCLGGVGDGGRGLVDLR